MSRFGLLISLTTSYSLTNGETCKRRCVSFLHSTPQQRDAHNNYDVANTILRNTTQHNTRQRDTQHHTTQHATLRNATHYSTPQRNAKQHSTTIPSPYITLRGATLLHTVIPYVSQRNATLHTSQYSRLKLLCGVLCLVIGIGVDTKNHRDEHILLHVAGERIGKHGPHRARVHGVSANHKEESHPHRGHIHSPPQRMRATGRRREGFRCPSTNEGEKCAT